MIHIGQTEHQKERGQGIGEGLRHRETPHEAQAFGRDGFSEMGGQALSHTIPSPRSRDEQRIREEDAAEHEKPVEDVRVRDREQSGRRREGRHEEERDEGACARIEPGDDVQDQSTGAELIGGDHCVRDDRDEGAQQARPVVIAQLQHVRDRQLFELARAAGDEIDQAERDPNAGVEPERREAFAIGQSRACDDRA